MISIRQIVLLVEQGSFHNLARRILANGRLGSAALDRALMDRQAVAPCAVALALQRCCELTYGPTEETALLASRLLRLQSAHGSERAAAGCFAPDSTHWVTATALALRALLDVQHQHGSESTAAMSRVSTAIDRAVQALEPHVLQEPGPDRATLAILFWQLGDEPAISARLGLEHLRLMLHASPSGAGDDCGSTAPDPVARFVALAAA